MMLTLSWARESNLFFWIDMQGQGTARSDTARARRWYLHAQHKSEQAMVCSYTMCSGQAVQLSLATIGYERDRLLANVVSGCSGELQELTSTGNIPPHR